MVCPVLVGDAFGNCSAFQLPDRQIPSTSGPLPRAAPGRCARLRGDGRHGQSRCSPALQGIHQLADHVGFDAAHARLRNDSNRLQLLESVPVKAPAAPPSPAARRGRPSPGGRQLAFGPDQPAEKIAGSTTRKGTPKAEAVGKITSITDGGGRSRQLGEEMKVLRSTVPLAGLVIALLTACSSEQPAVSPIPSGQETTPAFQQSPTPVAAAPEQPVAGQACPLAPEEVKQLLSEWLAPGEVTIDIANSESTKCSYAFPEGSFPPAGRGGTSYNGTLTPGLTFYQYEYADPSNLSMGVYNTRRQFGGSTPKEVIDSVYIAERDVGAASGRKVEVQLHPEIGGGVVATGGQGITVATTGAYWYKGGLSGINNPLYAPAMLEIAKAISAKG